MYLHKTNWVEIDLPYLKYKYKYIPLLVGSSEDQKTKNVFKPTPVLGLGSLCRSNNWNILLQTFMNSLMVSASDLNFNCWLEVLFFSTGGSFLILKAMYAINIKCDLKTWHALCSY